MRPAAILFLLFFVATLATSAAQAKKKRTLRLPLRRDLSDTTALFARSETQPFSLKSATGLYTANIAVGTPQQNFPLVIATAFPDITIADLFCKDCGDLAKYNGGASSTFKDLQTPYSVWGGLFTGTWTEDAFAFLDLAMKRPFARGLQVPGNWPYLGFSGMLGLGLHTSPPALTLLDYFSQSQLLDKSIVSCRFVKNNKEDAGEIIFGATEPQYIDGDIQMSKVVSGSNDAAWLIEIAGVQVGHKFITGWKTASVDTGVNYIYLTDPEIADLYDGSGAQRTDGNVWTVPDPFPYDISFIIDERMFVVPKEDIPLRELPKIGDFYKGAFQPFTSWILGTPFIQNHYLVFDFTKDNQYVGIAKRKS